MSPLINEGTDLAMRIGFTSGQTLVQTPSPLTRLNYFDGKFLRADDLRREQDYARQLVQFSNQGLGAGVVYGMDTVLDAQGRVSIGPGLAMDSTGRTLLIQSAAAFDIGALIDASRRIKQSNGNATTNGNADFGGCVDATSAPGDVPTAGGSLYVICIGHAESLCGTEDVYGRLCEEACITATDRPLIVEGVVVRALPLTLHTTLASSKAVALTQKHLRSLVASAFFEDERKVVACLISRAGLALDTWCLGADLTGVCCVPLAVVARAGSQTIFLDAWTARRERMEAPGRRYWAWRMCMRPWDAYLAQILQFQCQLHEVLGGDGDPGNVDPCANKQQVLDDAAKYLRDFDATYTRHIQALAKITNIPAELQNSDALFQLQGGAADLSKLRQQIDGALQGMIVGGKSRVLINGGICELPPAGYLPVVPGTVSVNTQVRRLLGEGLDLRFCVVRPDFVAHALEECQHMERISMLSGLDDPKAKQEVDILVPYGEMSSADVPKLAGFDTQVRLTATGISSLVATSLAGSGSTTVVVDSGTGSGFVAGVNAASTVRALVLHGAGRAERLAGGGGAFHFAGALEADPQQIVDTVRGIDVLVKATPDARAEMIAKVADRAGPAPVFARTDMLDGAVVARFAASAADARTSRAFAGLTEIATTQPTIGTPAPLPGVGAPPVGVAPPPGVAVPRAQGSMWSTMRSDRDPFALSVADATPMSVELVLDSEPATSAGTQTVLLRLRILGTFSVTQPSVDVTGGQRVAGHFSGTYTTQTFFNGVATTNSSPLLEVDIALLRSGGADAGTLKVTFGSQSARIVVMADASWGGQPLEATLKLSLGAGSTSGSLVSSLSGSSISSKVIELLSASAIASDDALTEGSALRMLSTSALELIGAAMTRANQGGTAYVDAALRNLFPPAPPPVDDLTVRATLDWVLFHRRRTKRCATPVERPPVTPPRRYQLYEYRAESVRDLVFIRQALRKPNDITKLPFKRVDVVEYAGGLATLLTAPDALLRDWAATQPGNTLIYGAIATSVAADAPLASPRLTRVAQGVAATSAIDPANSLFEAIPDVPTALAVPGTDGMIFLVTLNISRTTCHDVYRVDMDANALRLIESDHLASLLVAPETKHLVSVEFVDGSNTPATGDDAALTQAWTASGGGTPDGIFVYPNPADKTVADAATLTARGHALVTLVTLAGGTTNAVVNPRIAVGAWPVGPTCPVISVISVRALRTARVVAFHSGGVSAGVSPRIPLAHDVISFRGNALEQDAAYQAMLSDLQSNIGGGSILRRVTSVELVLGGASDSGDTGRLNTTVSALAGANPPVLDVASLDSPPGTRAATTPERPMLDEGGTTVNDLLVVIILQTINA